MSNLFVSVEYVGRYKDMYDKGYYSYIIDDRHEPTWQDQLEDLEAEVHDWLKTYKQFDAVSITILNFKEVG